MRGFVIRNICFSKQFLHLKKYNLFKCYCYFTDCGKAGDFRSITSHFRRRRAHDFSYQSDSASDGEALEMLENIREQMYNRQEIDIKMHDMENRLKDMQGIMQAMDHSMKKMKRNVNTYNIIKVIVQNVKISFN
jgi:hypothetical protein